MLLFVVGFAAAGKSTFAHALCATDAAKVTQLVQQPRRIAEWCAEELAEWVTAMAPRGWTGCADAAQRARLAAFLRAQGVSGGDVLAAERSKELARDSSAAVSAGIWAEFCKVVQNHDRKQ